MENQPFTNPSLKTPEAKGAVFTTVTPILREDTIELVEAQHTESPEEKALVVAKETAKRPVFSIKPFLQSLFYAVQWPQLKRQFTKEALLVNTKRHWTKLLVGGLLCYGTQITFNPAPNMHSTATILPSVTRSIPTVATQAQALVPATTVSIHAKEQYIARFVGVAQGEMKKYGIPASVILSLSIIESNYGTTPLAQAGNNYFALSCAANSLAEGIVERAMYQQTCYVHYENAWTSFRANSLRLGSANFQALKGEKDYHTWAAALEQQGLVEAVNLVGLIELHQLHQYDSVQEK